MTTPQNKLQPEQIPVKQIDKQREAALTIVTGFQGTGKTYNTIREIVKYLKAHPDRKVIIYDVQGEFSEEECRKHGVIIKIPKLGTTKEDILKFTHSPTERIRRIIPIDPQTGLRMSIEQMKQVLQVIINNFRQGLLLVEDMNKYLLQIQHVQEIISTLIGLRHQNLDVIIHLQSLSKIDPTLWQNTKYFRVHWEEQNVDRIKSRMSNYKLFKIAQLLINYQYEDKKNKTFFVRAYPQLNKLTGKFSEKDFALAYFRYLKMEKKELKDTMEVMNLSGRGVDDKKKAFQYLYSRSKSMNGNL